MTTKSYIVKRTFHTIALLLFVITFLFFFFRLLPGSYADIIIHRGATPEATEYLISKWGLDQPLYKQYLLYMNNVFQLDFGISFASQQPVLEYVGSRIFYSFILIAPGITFAYIFGTLYGAYLGNLDNDELEEYGIIPFIFLGAFPEFFISMVLIMVFAGYFGILPTSGAMSFETRAMYQGVAWWRPFLTLDFLKHYILPFTAVFSVYSFLPILIMRTSVAEVLTQDFFEYHKIKGLPKISMYKHLMKHSILPVITIYPVSMTRAIGGLILIEVVFNWPGIGALLVESIFVRDYPTIQFVFILIAFFIILSNFLVDLLYTYIDPRIRLEG